MMTMVVMVVVLTSSLAEAQFTCRRNPGRYISYGSGYRTVSRSYGYGCDSTFGKIIVGGQTLNQILVNDRVLSMAERKQAEELRMAREEQNFRHQQIRVQNNTVLVKREPIVLQVKKPEQTQSDENEKLRQEVKALRLELEKLKLQQELEKIKK